MGGYVYKRGEVQRVTIKPEQLAEIAKLLKIPAPTQVRGLSLFVTNRPPAAKKERRKKE